MGGEEGFRHEQIDPSLSSSEDWSSNSLENISLSNEESGLDIGEFPCMDPHVSLISEAAQRQRAKDCADIMKSYEESLSRIQKLEEAKKKILSYRPGSWAERAAKLNLSERDLSKVTTLLLIGPKGSGKSSLVNKISRVLDEDLCVSGRAQVSCNSAIGDGTYFLHEYTIPRDSGSFCLYDSRSLSVDSSENEKILEHWLKNGVRHGELVERKSDSMALKARLKCKARRNRCTSQARVVNFVIFVINGLSVLESLDSSHEDRRYSELMASSFNNPILSFKDDKPVVVVTHGDLLPLPERVRVRVYLGNLLGILPATQIFDIPESDDPSTTLAIYNMLIHCLDRADRHLPAKDLSIRKVSFAAVFLVFLVMALLFGSWSSSVHHQPPTIDHLQRAPGPDPALAAVQVKKKNSSATPMIIEWHKIRHLWSE